MSEQTNGHGDEVFVVVKLYTPKTDGLDHLLALGKKGEAALKEAPGLIQSQLLRPINETTAIGQISIWQSEADFKGFTASEAGQALLNLATHRQAEGLADAVQVLTFRHETGWHA